MHVHGSTLSVLGVIHELRMRLIEMVSASAERDSLAAAWDVASARFPVILSTLSSPEFLEANEELLMSIGVSGAEADFRAEQFHDAVTQLDDFRMLDDGASLLRSISRVELLSEAGNALADFCDGVRSLVGAQQSPRSHD